MSAKWKSCCKSCKIVYYNSHNTTFKTYCKGLELKGWDGHKMHTLPNKSAWVDIFNSHSHALTPLAASPWYESLDTIPYVFYCNTIVQLMRTVCVAITWVQRGFWSSGTLWSTTPLWRNSIWTSLASQSEEQKTLSTASAKTHLWRHWRKN